MGTTRGALPDVRPVRMEDEDAGRGAAVGSHRRAAAHRWARSMGRRSWPMSSRSWLATLSAGDIALMDNARTHKIAGVREAIEAKGARLIYLPPHSPDFDPIEEA